LRLLLLTLACASTAALSQRVDTPRSEPAAELLARAVPVTSGDVEDRPYRVVSRVETFVGKPLWRKPPSEEKVFKELWERARRSGADAVVRASYGAPQCEFFRSCGGRQASGDAIRFLTVEEAAQLGERGQ
jgi:hypothetical protein